MVCQKDCITEDKMGVFDTIVLLARFATGMKEDLYQHTES